MNPLKIIIAGAIICWAPSYGQTVMVANPEKNGWKITGDGIISIQSPTGETTDLSEKFKTENSNWTPNNIKCVWGNGLVAVFAQHPRLTEITVFNTKTNKKLKQTFLNNMPKWFETCRVIIDRPDGKWGKNTLKIQTRGETADGTSKEIYQIIKVNGNTFSTYPIKTPKPVEPNQPPTETTSQKPVTPPKHSLEFGSP